MKRKITKSKTVCVIGLGYVGLPVLAICTDKGYKAFGYEIDRKKVAMINKGKSPIKDDFLDRVFHKTKLKATADSRLIKKADIIVVCVPTPVDEKFYPDLKPLIGACETICQNLKKGALVIIESTVNPGVCEEIVAPIFKKHGFEVGRDVLIAHCPERIDPGNKKWTILNLPRVVGAFDKKGLRMAIDFYKSIINAEVVPMKSVREAEAVKIMENSFRDINIAFVNELAKSFDRMGIDITDVIRGASTKFSFMPHYPSCGVGGHCIPVDPYYLIERARLNNFNHQLLKIARKINNSMPNYTVNLLQKGLNKVKKSIKDAKIGVLGLAYKANIDDTRESPAFKIINLIKKKGGRVITFDPYVLEKSNVKNLKTLLNKSEAVILCADHREFRKMSAEELKKSKVEVVIDGKNCLDGEKIKRAGIIYKGIGR